MTIWWMSNMNFRKQQQFNYFDTNVWSIVCCSLWLFWHFLQDDDDDDWWQLDVEGVDCNEHDWSKIIGRKRESRKEEKTKTKQKESINIDFSFLYLKERKL